MKKCLGLLFLVFNLFIHSPVDLIAQWKPNSAINPQGKMVIRPRLIDDVLMNPGIGFTTFMRFNGDTLTRLNNNQQWVECVPIVYQSNNGNLINKDYPQTSTAYWRVYWRYVEPENGKYRWDLVEQALDSAQRRGQRLVFRVAPYGKIRDGVLKVEDDVPGWYRKLVGPYKKNSTYFDWVVDPEDEKYVQHFGKFVRELGKRYDGHPALDAVDLSIVGPWGEGAGSHYLSEKTRRALVDCYTQSFKKTNLLALLTDISTNSYAAQHKNAGIRIDCFGDIGRGPLDAPTPGWCHMYDYYPEKLSMPGQHDVWKNAPVHFEICYTFHTWKDRFGYGIKELEYIIEQSLKWHISVFNAKSSPVPEEWMPLINEWLKKMGYRYALRSLKTDQKIKKGENLYFETWWENRGVAPMYDENYKVHFRLTDEKSENFTLKTDIDLRNWLPGDNYYKGEIEIPSNIAPGNRTLQVAVIDQRTGLPAVQLGNDGKQNDGWYNLGYVNLGN